jgi:hypothetical protein
MPRMLFFITKHTVKDGRLDDLERLNDEFVEFVEASEPRIHALNAYLDDTGTRLTLVQVHPDAASMDFHLQVAADRIHQAFEVVDNDGVEVYGSPGPVTSGLLEQIGSAGVPVSVCPNRLGGFVRSG